MRAFAHSLVDTVGADVVQGGHVDQGRPTLSLTGRFRREGGGHFDMWL